MFSPPVFRRTRTLGTTCRVATAAAWLTLCLGCRPAGYVATPEEPTAPRDPLPESPEELTHLALYGEDFASAAVLTPPPGAAISQSGLASVVLRRGSGNLQPKDKDAVLVRFNAWDSRGQRYDSTALRGKPDRLRLNEQIQGYQEALAAMVVGEKRRLWIPERLAFGPLPSPGRPAGDIVVDLELVQVIPGPAAPTVPADLTAPPADAVTTATGLRYKVLTAGRGSAHPKRTDRVLVHYSGWDQNGQMFDSSVARGEPVAFGVEEVIAGWTELLLLMAEGERTRVWIPAALAYGETPDRPGTPAGPLVFDVELIEIQH